MLELDVLENPRKALAAAEHDRRDDDRQLVDQAGLERLPDTSAPPMMLTTLSPAASTAARPPLHAVDEGEVATVGLLLRPVGDDEDGTPQGFLSPQWPAAS